MEDQVGLLRGAQQTDRKRSREVGDVRVARREDPRDHAVSAAELCLDAGPADRGEELVVGDHVGIRDDDDLGAVEANVGDAGEIELGRPHLASALVVELRNPQPDVHLPVALPVAVVHGGGLPDRPRGKTVRSPLEGR